MDFFFIVKKYNLKKLDFRCILILSQREIDQIINNKKIKVGNDNGYST